MLTQYYDYEHIVQTKDEIIISFFTWINANQHKDDHFSVEDVAKYISLNPL